MTYKPKNIQPFPFFYKYEGGGTAGMLFIVQRSLYLCCDVWNCGMEMSNQ